MDRTGKSWPLWLGAYIALALFSMAFMGLGQSFQLWLAILYPLVGFFFCLVHAIERMGPRPALLFLGLTLAISLALETVGVATGWIYGPYHYADHRLGPHFLGLVPYVIPLTWFLMLYPSYLIAQHCTPAQWRNDRRLLAVAAVGGLVMAAWDLALDPLMAAQGHWVWERPGLYFSVPLQNYWGWWLTAFVILALFQRIGGEPAQNPGEPGLLGFDRLAMLIYLVTGLASAGEAWSQGLTGPALAGGSAMLFWFLLAWRAPWAVARP